MSRQQTVPDSIYAGAGGGGGLSFLETNTITATMSGPVAQNELVVLHESGNLFRADPTWPWAAINQDSSAPVAITAPVTIDDITLTSVTVANAMGDVARLINGTYVIPMHATNVGFCIRSSTGLEVTGFIQAAAEVSAASPFVVALDSGNFAFFWHSSSSIKLMIFDPTGAVVTAVATVATSVYVAGTKPWHGHCKLTGVDQFVISWTTTGGALLAQIYSNIGAAVGSQIAIDTTIAGNMHLARPCANGDFLIGCFDSTHSRHKVYRYTNAGVFVWGPIVPSAATAMFTSPDTHRIHPQHNRMTELSNGNIVWMLPNTSSYANAFILTSGGSLLRTVDFGVTYHDAGVAAPLILTANGFAIAHSPVGSPQNTYSSYFDINGVVLVQNSLVDTGSFNFASPTIIYYLGYVGAAISIARYAFALGLVETRLFHVDHRGGIIGDIFGLQPKVSSDMAQVIPVSTLDGVTFTAWFAVGPNKITVSSYKTGISSVIGWAAASVAANVSVQINGSGYVTLPATQTFGVGASFDNRGKPVWGTRGVVGGNKAFLAGWAS